MTDCLFCKIVRGEIPATKVFENHTTIAFLDIHPVNPGHILIVPKEHHENILETPDAIVADMMRHVKLLARAVMEAVGAPGFNIGVNTGVVAGQVIMHTHVHVMPRFVDDGLVHWGKKDVSPSEMQRVAEEIKKRLQ